MLQLYKKTKSEYKIKVHEDGKTGGGLIMSQGRALAMRRWHKLTNVLKTITRLNRHRTKRIDDPVRDRILTNYDLIE